ncbi:MAG TPA: hypothetical protein VGH99_13725 [Pseudonocardia sp.]
MIPEGYHDFFLGAVTVGAALVGLLFVSISVNPGGAALTGELTMRLRATSAFSALLNALFVSLVALLPESTVGGTVVGVAASGLLTVLGLLLMLVVKGRETGFPPLVRMVVLTLGQGTIYAFQIVGGVRLVRDPGDLGEVQTQAILIVVLLVVGVLRAWEYVGARRIGLLATVAEAARGPRPGDAATADARPDDGARTPPAPGSPSERPGVAADDR